MILTFSLESRNADKKGILMFSLESENISEF